ncbi:MAG TPA: dihydrofolate reductase family protein, partial [Candidatus Dormibacteraeota bacterium]|nr:dihydrofolate reductase family protein [Candidatus Dormibacteraeota bacterium]
DGAADALALNRAWIAARRAARPFVGLKLAMSLDGRIATTTGESRWITGPESRAEAHRLRAAYAAVAVGAGTVLADDPELTARDAAGARLDRQPLRLVVDGRLRISPAARLLDSGLPGRALVATSAGGAAARGAEFAGTLLVVGDDGASAGDGVSAGGGAAISAGPTFPSPTTAADTGPDPRRVAMADLLRVLAGQGVDSLLVEGGGDLAWSFVAAGLVDHVHALVAPILIGGREAPSAVSGEGFARLENALGLRFVATRNLGDDLLLEAIPASTRPGAPDSEGTPGEAPPTSPGAESSTREP